MTNLFVIVSLLGRRHLQATLLCVPSAIENLLDEWRQASERFRVCCESLPGLTAPADPATHLHGENTARGIGASIANV
jgi:hypothetical protein